MATVGAGINCTGSVGASSNIAADVAVMPPTVPETKSRTDLGTLIVRLPFRMSFAAVCRRVFAEFTSGHGDSHQLRSPGASWPVRATYSV
jgi:hypothetical protein